MDILKPDLLWLEGRCYRINDSAFEVTNMLEHDLYDNDISCPDTENDEDDDFEVETTANNRYKTSFHVANPYIGSIIGKKGAVRSRLEHDTRTEIKIPKQGQTGDIVITGSNPANVKTARRRINMIVMSSRKRQRPTHLISIPINSPQIQENFLKFRDLVVNEFGANRIEASLFARPIKLHLTLGVMCLMDNEERLEASRLLKEARDKYVMPLLQSYAPVQLRMQGVSYMNDDPSEIDVLYGEVREDNAPNGLLQKIADSLLEHFDAAGFGSDSNKNTNVKLHVTLMNTKFRGRGDIGSPEKTNRDRGTRQSFDGKLMLEKYRDYDFGVTTLNEIHLSALHISTGSERYYDSTCVISCLND